MIEFSNVFLKYTREFYALYNINLKIEEGEKVCLFGKTDSGKSCLLRLLAGIEKLTKGEIYINKIPVKKVDYEHDINVGYIPYKATFFENKTVYENLKYVLKIRKNSVSEQETMINEALINFKLESLRDIKIKTLSLYEKYLVSIARLSFRKLNLVLIDNIFEELNKEENKKLTDLIKDQYIKPEITLIYATSDEELSKIFKARVVKLENGSLTD